jgi:hypothetical protein
LQLSRLTIAGDLVAARAAKAAKAHQRKLEEMERDHKRRKHADEQPRDAGNGQFVAATHGEYEQRIAALEARLAEVTTERDSLLCAERERVRAEKVCALLLHHWLTHRRATSP